MKTKKIVISILAFVSLLSVALLGCGDTKQTSGEPKGQETQKLMEDIKKRGKMVVGTEAAFAPFEFVEDGKIIGYEPDIMREIAKNLGVEIEFVDTPFSGLLTSLGTKKFDFIAAGLTATPERRSKYDFTSPLCEETMGVIKRFDDDSIKTIEDLNGKIIAVLVNSAGADAVAIYDKKLKEDGKSGLKEVRTYQNLSDAHMDLSNSRVDAVVQSSPALYVLIKNKPNTYAIVGALSEKAYISLVVRKEDKEFLALLNEEILKLKKSGKLAELQEKWFGIVMDLPDTLPN